MIRKKYGIEKSIKHIFTKYNKLLLVVAIAVFVASSTGFIQAFREPLLLKHTLVERYAKTTASVDHIVVVKPSLAYGYREEVPYSEVYLNLVRSINISITYTIVVFNNTGYGYVDKIETTYSIPQTLYIGDWSKQDYLINPVYTTKTSTFSNILIDVDKAYKYASILDKEVNLKTNKFSYIIEPNYITKVTYEGGETATYSLKPKITILMDLEKNRLIITSSNLEKEYSDKQIVSRVNYIKSLGIYTISVSDARKYFLVFTILSGALLLFITYHIVSSKKTRISLKRIISPSTIVKGSIVDSGSLPIVEISDPKEFSNIVKYYKKPVVETRENDLIVYSIITSESIFTYYEHFSD